MYRITWKAPSGKLITDYLNARDGDEAQANAYEYSPFAETCELIEVRSCAKKRFIAQKMK